jgi:LacI family transcriptional regulator
VGAGRALGQHLVELDHRRVAIVGGPDSLNTVADRIAGLTEVLGDRVVSVSNHTFDRAGGSAGVRALLDGHGLEGTDRRPTAIAALSDVMAIGVLAELRGRGLAVPSDVSVAGFDDIAVAADLAPALTTARFSLASIGAQALRLTTLEPANSPRKKRVGFELIVRGSSGYPVLPSGVSLG